MNERNFITLVAATLRLKIPVRDRIVGIWDEKYTKDSPFHVAWMLDEIVIHFEDWPLAKLNRWLGYCQGVLACHDVIDIDEEIERVRKMRKMNGVNES